MKPKVTVGRALGSGFRISNSDFVISVTDFYNKYIYQI